MTRQPNGSYNHKGATDAHLIQMRSRCGPGVGIKATGGMRTVNDLLRVRALGVTRVGARATEEIMEEAIRKGFVGDKKIEVDVPLENEREKQGG